MHVEYKISAGRVASSIFARMDAMTRKFDLRKSKDGCNLRRKVPLHIALEKNDKFA